MIVGRVFGGISTSLLHSVFESWMIAAHHERKFEERLLDDTFSWGTFLNGFSAIISGLIANGLVDFYGLKSPFLFASFLVVISFVFIILFWGENYGISKEKKVEAKKGTKVKKDGQDLFAILANPRILSVGVMQCCFESAMYTFVFLWSPVLESIAALPFGVIFATFMVHVMIGSQIFKYSTNKSSFEFLSVVVFLIATVSFTIPISEISAVLAFNLFEASCGLYFPTIGSLRSRIIPEGQRATVMNFFRIPLNLTVVLVLLVVNSLSLESRFLVCGGLTGLGLLLSLRLQLIHVWMCYICLSQQINKNPDKNKENEGRVMKRHLHNFDYDKQDPSLLITPPVSATLVIHVTLMATSFLFLFPLSIIYTIKRNPNLYLLFVGFALFHIAYFFGHKLYGYRLSSFHVHSQPYVFYLVYVLTVFTICFKTTRSEFLRKAHYLLLALFVIMPILQMGSGVTASLGICQPSEVNNCMAHFGMGFAFIAVAFIGMFTQYQHDVLIAVILFFGILNTIVTHRWGTNWSHRDYQHTLSGVFWFFGGVLGLIYRSKNIVNPFPYIVLFVEGIQMIFHDQNSSFALVLHIMFGMTLVGASTIKLLSLYGNIDTRVLVDTLWVTSGMFFMGGSSDAIYKLKDSKFDAGSYSMLLASIGFAIIVYFHLMAYLISFNNKYRRLESFSSDTTLDDLEVGKFEEIKDDI
ncbi:Molybdate-anion transporter [Terramyces sp. JEL0728]|nr:Molybdate-anion transporter [Terramyces sp. JEL0728]